MLVNINLKSLINTWKNNPRITRNELITLHKSDAQNITRWMDSAGFLQVRDKHDKEWRYIPHAGVEIQVIKETPPEGLSERQRTEFYIELGYDSYSISVHQNVLWSTIEERREDLKKSKEEEYGQHKDNYTELGDKSPLPQGNDHTKISLFEGDNPSLSWKERHDLSWQDVIKTVHEKMGYYFLDDCIPYVPIVVRVPQYALRYYTQWKRVKSVGEPHEDMMIAAFQLGRNTEAFLMENRWNWIGDQVASVREEMRQRSEANRKKKAEEIEKSSQTRQLNIASKDSDPEKPWND